MFHWSGTPRATNGQTPEQPSSDGLSSGSERADEEERADGEELTDLLSDPHCRYLLKYLRDNDNPVSVAELVRYVVAELTDTEPEDAPEDVQRRVQTWFHHGQLPALDDHGVVEFDPESGTVTLAADPRLQP